MPKTAVDPGYLKLLLAYEDRRFCVAWRRRSAGARPRGASARHPRPHRLRRLDDHDAIGAADGAAARALGLRQAAPDGARGSDRAATEQGRNPRSLSGAGAVRRQSRRRPRRVDRLFRQGAEAAVAGGIGAAGGAAAIAGTPPARPLSGSRARRARPRARPDGRGWRACRRTTRRRPRRSRCRGCASRCRFWRRIPPMPRWRR